jgi:hypothetical protein
MMRAADSAADEVSGRIASVVPAAAAKNRKCRLQYGT